MNRELFNLFGNIEGLICMVIVKKDVMKNAASKRLIPEIKEALLKLKDQQDRNKTYFSEG